MLENLIRQTIRIQFVFELMPQMDTNQCRMLNVEKIKLH